MLPNALQPSATDHVPVLADEVRELLAVRPGETVVDATFGAGGHSSLLVQDLQGRGKLIAIDRDPGAREYFDRLAKRTPVQARFLRGDFSVVLEQLAQNGVEADAILLDLGVSSMQIDRPERGFSYIADAPLDMRMDPSADVTAARNRQRGSRTRPRDDLQALRRGALLAPDRARNRPPPQGAAVRDDARPRRDDQGRDPRAGALRRRPSREARLPGAPHRRQRRARRARGCAAVRVRDAPTERPAGSDQLPLARGPAREAVHARARTRLRLPARLPRVRVREGARGALVVAEGNPSQRA